MSRIRTVGSLGIAAVVCSWTSAAAAAIWGDDDRTEVYAHPDAAWQELARRSVVAMLKPTWAVCGRDAEVVPPTLTVGESEGLCEGVAFADQPVVARCSAMLVDRDLILTARHCIPDPADCSTAVFALGLYYEARDRLRTLTVDDIHSCKQIIAGDPAVDAIVVQLDRPAGPAYQPAPLSSVAVALDDAVGVIGFPAAMPMKISSEGVVKSLLPGVLHTADMFPGNSGSALLSSALEIVGVQNTSPGHYQQQGDCRVLKLYTEEGIPVGSPGNPQFAGAVPLADILPLLCNSAWPTPLCGGAASCGDGICSGSETAASCPADCTPSMCGDGHCSVLEELDCDDCSHLTECGEGGSGGAGGASATSGTGGSGGSAGASSGGGGTAPVTGEDAACGCRAPRGGGRTDAWWGLIVAALLWRRRRANSGEAPDCATKCRRGRRGHEICGCCKGHGSCFRARHVQLKAWRAPSRSASSSSRVAARMSR